MSLARRPQPAASCLSRDDDAFRSLIEPHRPALHAHCYRMLGSLHDAEDALQNTLLRAWRALPKFRGQSSLRNWLYRIATNVCLDAIARRPKRVLTDRLRTAHKSGRRARKAAVGRCVDRAVR